MKTKSMSHDMLQNFKRVKQLNERAYLKIAQWAKNGKIVQ